MKLKVLLIRGNINPLMFLAKTEAGAKRVATAWANLHLAEVNETEDTFIVNASDFYMRKQ